MRKHLTYANVTATAALVLAAGTGGAWAVDQISGSQLVDRSVRGRKLANDTVTARQVKESSLRGLVKGGGRVRSGRTVAAGSDPSVLAKALNTPAGRFTLGCGAANADTRFKNTTAGGADVYRTVGVVEGPDVGEEPDDTDRDHVTLGAGGDVGYAVTELTGPRTIEMFVGKGGPTARRVAILRATASRDGDSCTWNWELTTNG